MFRFIVLASVLAISVQGQYQSDPKQVAIISEQRYLSGNGKFGAAYTQEDGTQYQEEVLDNGDRKGTYSYIDPEGNKRTITYTAGKNGFQATGDHLPVAPPAPAHAQLAAQAAQSAQYNPKAYDASGNPNVIDENGFETGEYDPRYNDPNFSGNFRSLPAQSTYSQPAPQQPSYHVQAQPQAQPQPQPQQPQYNNVNYNIPQYQTTTPYPHRFQPPGKLSLSRTPDGFSYSFNKV